jgi:hypothetical protein
MSKPRLLADNFTCGVIDVDSTYLHVTGCATCGRIALISDESLEILSLLARNRKVDRLSYMSVAEKCCHAPNYDWLANEEV